MKFISLFILIILAIHAWGQENKIPIHYDAVLYDYSIQFPRTGNWLRIEKTDITQKVVFPLLTYIKQFDSIQSYAVPQNANTRPFAGFSDTKEEWVGNNYISYPKSNHIYTKGDTVCLNDTFAITVKDSYLLPNHKTTDYKEKCSFTETWEFNKETGSFIKEVKQVGLSLRKQYPKFLLNTAPYTDDVIQAKKGTDSTYIFSDQNIFLGKVYYTVNLDQLEYENTCRDGVVNPENSAYKNSILPPDRRNLVIDILDYIRMEYENGNQVAFSTKDSLAVLPWDDVLKSVYIEEMYYPDTTRKYYMFNRINAFNVIGFHELWYYDKINFSLKKVVRQIELFKGGTRYCPYSPHFQIKLKSKIDNKKSPFADPQVRMLNQKLYTKNNCIFKTNGKRVLKDSFETVHFFKDNILRVDKLKGTFDTITVYNESTGDEIQKLIPHKLTGFINAKGKYILKPNHITHYNWELESKNWLQVEKEGKHGVINKNKNFIIPQIYDAFKGTHKGYIIAQKEGLWGLIDSTNKIQIDFQYEEIKSTYKSLFVKKNGKWGVIDYKNNSIINIEYEDIDNFYSNFKAKKNGKWGMLLQDNKVLRPFEYDYFEDLDYNSYIAKKGGKYGVFGRDGNERLPIMYDTIKNIGRSYETRLLLKKKDKYGIAEEDLSISLSCIYDTITYYRDSFYFAVKNGKMGVVTSGDSILIPFQNDDIDHWHNKFRVKRGNKFAFFSLKGKQLTKFIFDEIKDEFLNYSIVRIGDKYGVVNAKGKTTVPVKFTEIEYTKRRAFRRYYNIPLEKIKLDGLYYTINEQGEIVE